MGFRGNDPGVLLEWMTRHHLPLELFREQETELWVVVDTSQGQVLASGESTYSALNEAYDKELKAN